MSSYIATCIGRSRTVISLLIVIMLTGVAS
jgi:hypothetical protein